VASLEGELLVCRGQSGRPTPLFWLLVAVAGLSVCLTILRVVYMHCRAGSRFPVDR